MYGAMKRSRRLLFARPECLGLSEHLGSNAGLGFYGKSVLPPVCIDFDYCVGLLVVDSIWFPAYDLRSESCRAQEPLEGCFDQFCVLGFAFHLWANLIRSYFLVVHEARTPLNKVNEFNKNKCSCNMNIYTMMNNKRL